LFGGYIIKACRISTLNKVAIIYVRPQIFRIMINFSVKDRRWRFKLRKTENRSYIKHFNDAILNLELNLQEERIRTPFDI